MIAACPHCQQQIDITGMNGGDQFACPHCNSGIVIYRKSTVQPIAPPPFAQAPSPPPFQPQSPSPAYLVSYCRACGQPIHQQAAICMQCGVAVEPSASGIGPARIGASGHRMIAPSGSGIEPGTAAVLSLIIPGLPQMMVGQTAKGAVLLASGFVLMVVTVCIGNLVLHVVASIDAYKIVEKLRSGRAVGEWEFF